MTSPGSVHLGYGAFFRAHIALYTQEAMDADAGQPRDWGIVAVAPRSTDTVYAARRQGSRHTVIERDTESVRAITVSSVCSVLSLEREREAVLRRLADGATRLVTLTVTEKGYSADGVIVGLLADAMARRRREGVAPLSVLSCDNLPANGRLLQARVREAAARRHDDALMQWIEREIAFPCSMVDRIVPAPTPATAEAAVALTGQSDPLAVETEPYRQWVIEDRFAAGRPPWDAGGATFVDDVAPWEHAKLGMLNGAHTLIAFAGQLLGLDTVDAVAARAAVRRQVLRHMRAAASVLPPRTPDHDRYARDLLARFDNTALAHRCEQIATDASEKVPLRWLEFAVETEGDATGDFCFAFALFVRWCSGVRDDGTRYRLNDPRGEALAQGDTEADARDDVPFDAPFDASAGARADARANARADARIDSRAHARARLDAVLAAFGDVSLPFVDRPEVRREIVTSLQSMLDEGVDAAFEGRT